MKIRIRYVTFFIVGIIILIAVYIFHENQPEKPEKIVVPVFTPPQKRYKKTENTFREIVEQLFGCTFQSCRPDFLRNPMTGKNLELDMYNDRLKLAFEYQGIQHRKFTPLFHKSVYDFQYQLWKDQLKKNLCKKAGIRLICISDTTKPSRENVINLLNSN